MKVGEKMMLKVNEKESNEKNVRKNVEESGRLEKR